MRLPKGSKRCALRFKLEDAKEVSIETGGGLGIELAMLNQVLSRRSQLMTYASRLELPSSHD